MENKDTRTFKINPEIEMKKVQFMNRYGITLAGDLYLPKNYEDKKNPAVIVAGPFGAVKEQASGLYAQELAARGFVSIAFDPSFGGESGGEVRNTASPDIFTEDYSAAGTILVCSPMLTGSVLAQSAYAGFREWRLPLRERIPELKR